MATFTIDELIKSYTPDEVREHLLSLLEANSVPARSWRPGAVMSRFLRVGATLGSQATVFGANVVAGLFLLLGKGTYLTAKAKDDFDVDRIPATFASGPVRLTNTGGAVYNVGADECIVRASTTKARFRITEAFTLTSFGEVTVNVSAIESGSSSTVSAGEVNEFETPLALVTVTNPGALVGRDAESDEDLRSRSMLKRGTWSSNGPSLAYEYAALSATMPDGSPTGITRVRVSPWSSTGEVYVYCATPSGTPTSDELDAVRASVAKYAKTDTDKVFVVGATPVSTANTVTIYARGGVRETILARAQAEVAKLISTYPIGGIAKTDGGQGYLYLDAIGAACIRSSIDESTGQSVGYDVFDVDYAPGDTDTALAVDEVANNTTTFDVRIR